MNKLPVGQIIRSAYAFTFGEIGTVIGLIWIPTLINAIASFIFLEVGGGADGSAAVPGAFVLYVIMLVVLTAMMAVAVTKQALGIRKGPALAYFSLGANEWRVVGGFGLLYLVLMAFLLMFGLIGAVLGLAGGAVLQNQSVMVATAGALGLVGVAAMIYVFVRLSFFFVPVALNEGGLSLPRSWQLTAGNFWRIFAIGLAVTLPLLIVQAGAEYIVLGPGYFDSIAKALADPANIARYQAEQAEMARAATPVLLGISLVLAPILQGLLWAPAAFAYRVLSGKVIVADHT